MRRRDSSTSSPAPLPLVSVALTALRKARGWNERELAVAVGLSVATISLYERGKYEPSRERIEQLVTAMRYEVGAFDDLLASLSRAVDRTSAAAPSQEAPSPAQLRRIHQVAADLSLASYQLTQGRLIRQVRTRNADKARRRAAGLWAVLKTRTAKERRLLVEHAREFQTWALAERLCHESEIAASDRAERALELARLALRVAERVPGEERWRLRLEGYVLAFVASAQRVANDARRAEESFARSRELWAAGAPADPAGLLAEWRLFDLEASLHRDQGRFPAALELSERALATCPPEATGRILVKKAAALEDMGEAERAIATLLEATPLVVASREPHLRFALQFNLGVNLCQLERYAEARDLLPEVRGLAIAQRKQLDLVRVVWLEGRVAAGLGQPGEAEGAFEQVRGEFRQRQMAYDYALVTLELAALYLAQGRCAEARELAHQLVWIFEAKGIHREALAALRLFRQAALGEDLTAELARRIVRYLHRAQHHPELRFAP